MKDQAQQGVEGGLPDSAHPDAWRETLRAELEWADAYERAAERDRAQNRRDLPHGMPHWDLAQTGWGIILAPSRAAEIQQQLEPLLEHRRKQVDDAQLFRIIHYTPGESARDFLWYKHGSGPGVIDPQAMPYYLLIAASPAEIRWEFQYQLSHGHAVGRIWFEDLSDYGRYAASIVAAEKAGAKRPKRLAMLSVEDDETIRILRRHLLDPLRRHLGEKVPDWAVETWSGQAAERSVVLDRLQQEAPALWLAACHGVRRDWQDPEQKALQGALACSRTPGQRPGEHGRHRLRAADLDAWDAKTPEIHGLIAFLFACFGAGTPSFDDFPYEDDSAESQGVEPGDRVRSSLVAKEPFVAALPMAMMRRGALAVVGHVDRGWIQSFRWDYRGRASRAAHSLEDTVVRLLSGHRLGYALRPVHKRASELATHLIQMWGAKSIRGAPVDSEQLQFLFRAYYDARNFVILGDPAVRIRGGWQGPPVQLASISAREQPGSGEDGAPAPAFAGDGGDAGGWLERPLLIRGPLARRIRERAEASHASPETWLEQLLQGQGASGPRRAVGGSAAKPMLRALPWLPPTSVHVQAPSGHADLAPGLFAGDAAEPLIVRVEKAHLADLFVSYLEPRPSSGAGDPAPALGAVAAPGWVLVDRQQTLLAPFLPATEPDLQAALRAELWRSGRRLALRRLAALASSGPRDPWIEVELRQRRGLVLEPVEPARPAGMRVLESKTEIELLVHSYAPEPLWTLILDLGAGGGLDRMRPGPDLRHASSDKVLPGQMIEVQGRALALPNSYPFHQPGEAPAFGCETLMVFASREPFDPSPWFARPDVGSSEECRQEASALGRVLGSLLVDGSMPPLEALESPDWTLQSLDLVLRRPAR